jgi:hypothetical protein
MLALGRPPVLARLTGGSSAYGQLFAGQLASNPRI